jgi:hypothetical protein
VANALPHQPDEVPAQVASVLPSGAGHTQAIVNSLQGDISDIKKDIRWLLGIYAGGFLLLAGAGASAVVGLYFKLDEKMEKLSSASIRVETKLEDLLARIPPAVTPPPKRQ